MNSTSSCLLRAFGTTFLMLGMVGTVVPLLPTTPFLLLAAGCFARSSPQLSARLAAHPIFGPALTSWRQEGAIATRAKVTAVAMMALGYGITLAMVDLPMPARVALAAILVGCAGFIVTRPSPTAPLRRPRLGSR